LAWNGQPTETGRFREWWKKIKLRAAIGPDGPQPDATKWKEAWAIVAKQVNGPEVRNYLWSGGFQPTAELALEWVKHRAMNDPEFARETVGFAFYAVRVDMRVEIVFDPGIKKVIGVEYGG
jgi:hypothetical protein